MFVAASVAIPSSGTISLSNFYGTGGTGYTDPQWANVIFLADYEADITNQAPITGTTANTIERTGNGSITISQSSKKYGNNALFTYTFTGITQSPLIRYTLPSLGNIAPQLSTGRQSLGNVFTVEFWAAANTVGYTTPHLPMRVLGTRDQLLSSSWVIDEWLLELPITGGIRMNSITNWLPYTNGNAALITSTPATKDGNTWCHYALCRNGNTLYWCVNGAVLVDSTSWTNSRGSLIGFRIDRLLVGAAEYSQADGFRGRLDDIRITVGNVRYPGPTTYAVPTRALKP